MYNHELSWLSFNWRVLAMAQDPTTPLFERLRFVAIAARNLDEFFAKRVGALKRQEAAGVENLVKKRDKTVWTPQEQLRLISQAVQEQDEAVSQTLLADVLPKLRHAGVYLLDYDELTKTERLELREWFLEKVEPLLTPLAVDPGHPFPFIASLTLSIAVELMDADDDESLNAGASGGVEKHTHFAIVTVPVGLGACLHGQRCQRHMRPDFPPSHPWQPAGSACLGVAPTRLCRWSRSSSTTWTACSAACWSCQPTCSGAMWLRACMRRHHP